MDAENITNKNKEESLEKDSSLVESEIDLEESSRVNRSELLSQSEFACLLCKQPNRPDSKSQGEFASESSIHSLIDLASGKGELGKRKLNENETDISGNIIKKRKLDKDDSSIDSKGNIRDLIDYNCKDEKRSKRAAAIKANNTIKNIIHNNIQNERKRITPTLIKPLTYNENKKELTKEDEDEDEYNFDDDSEEDEDYDNEESEDNEDNKKSQRIIINISNLLEDQGEDEEEYDIEDETDEVKKFVELISKPVQNNKIANQIDEFKKLSEQDKKNILNGLEIKQTTTNELSIMCKIMNMVLPNNIKNMILNKYIAVQNMDKGNSEYYKQNNWIENVCSVPFGTYKDIPVRVEDGFEKCGEFIQKAREYLDSAIYGQDEAKLQIIQFIGNKIINPDAKGLSLLLIGPPGIGKTSLIKNGIAKALGWPFQFISLGGDSDASTYTGHQLVYEGSHYGKIAGSVIAAKSLSMVLMFDELDKISTTSKGEEVQNMLIHLTDPVQNGDFEDKYMAGIPIDLGKTMFVFSGNDITKIDRVLLDRMVVIQLDGYDITQKLQIVEKYIIPETLKESRLEGDVIFTNEILKYIIKEYANKESGVRELRRCIESIIQKINILRMYNNKVLPYYIDNFSLPFNIKKDHVDLFLKKKDAKSDGPPVGMYI